MPLYEYICKKCGHEFEEIQKFSDKPLTHCDECNTEQVVKKVSLSAFALKGEGWYKDGYARPSEQAKTDTTKPTTSSKPDTTKTPPPKSDTQTKPSTKKDKTTS